jgi:hypothetical protein
MDTILATERPCGKTTNYFKTDDAMAVISLLQHATHKNFQPVTIISIEKNFMQHFRV